MRNVKTKGSFSGLNQTSASFPPRYFKAAHCSEGGCSAKFTAHLLPQNEPQWSNVPPPAPPSLPHFTLVRHAEKTTCCHSIPFRFALRVAWRVAWPRLCVAM